jgi:CheY-like chemotaxis protein
MLVECDPDVRHDPGLVLAEYPATRRRRRGIGAWDEPVATLPSSGPPAPAPIGEGESERTEVPSNRDGVVGDRQERADPSTRRDTIRVLLVDDHVAVRQAFAVALNGETDLEVVGDAGGGLAALEQTRRLRPDVILMDVNLPGMSGIEATRRLRAEFPQIEVIGLSMYESEELEAAMRTAGARAYVSKSASLATLLAALRAFRDPAGPA